MHLSGTHDCSSKRIGSRSIWALYLCENEKRKNSKSGKNTAVDTLTIGRCSSKNHIVRCGMLISGHVQMVALAKCISLYERLSADSFSTSSFLFYLRGAANSHQMRVLIGSITLSCSLAPSQIGKYVRHSTMCVTHTKPFGSLLQNRFLIILTWKYRVQLYEMRTICVLFIESGGIGSLNSAVWCNRTHSHSATTVTYPISLSLSVLLIL